LIREDCAWTEKRGHSGRDLPLPPPGVSRKFAETKELDEKQNTISLTMGRLEGSRSIRKHLREVPMIRIE
jgi:hypothetical protein